MGHSILAFSSSKNNNNTNVCELELNGHISAASYIGDGLLAVDGIGRDDLIFDSLDSGWSVARH